MMLAKHDVFHYKIEFSLQFVGIVFFKEML
jgi:hypothetical protein